MTRQADDQRTDIRELSSALGISKQGALKKAREWPYTEIQHRGRPRRIFLLADLPQAIVVAVLRHRHHARKDAGPSAEGVSVSASRGPGEYDSEALWAQYLNLSERQRSVAEAKHTVILSAVAAHQDHGVPLLMALRTAAKGSRWSYATLRDVYYGKPGRPGLVDYDRKDWLPILAPRHRGRQQTDISPEAFEHFKADYLRPGAPAANACFRRLQAIAADKGWKIPETPKPLIRRLERTLHRATIVLSRQGVDALDRMMPAQVRDRSHLRALEAVNSDGHKFDVFVRWPDGQIARPVLTAWQDVRSTKILSWRVDRSESSDSYRLAFADLLREYGIPSHVYVDNSRAIAAKQLTGGTPNRYRFKVRESDPIGLLTHLVGPSGIHFTTPYHGQSKPIERRFRDFCEDIAKHPRFDGAYTGNRPDTKPENYGSRAVPLEEFLKVVEAGIHESNQRPGRRGLGMQGRSCDEVFRESYERHAHRIPRPTESQLTQWLLCAERLVAHNETGEIRLLGSRYWSESLAALAQRPRKDREVLVYFDPDHLNRPVYVHALDGRMIGRADVLGRARFDSQEDARREAQARNQFRRGARMQKQAALRLKPGDVAAALDEAHREDQPQTPKEQRVVRGAFRNPERRAVGYDIPDHDGAELQSEKQFARAIAPYMAAFRADSLVGGDTDEDES